MFQPQRLTFWPITSNVVGYIIRRCGPQHTTLCAERVDEQVVGGSGGHLLLSFNPLPASPAASDARLNRLSAIALHAIKRWSPSCSRRKSTPRFEINDDDSPTRAGTIVPTFTVSAAGRSAFRLCGISRSIPRGRGSRESTPVRPRRASPTGNRSGKAAPSARAPPRKSGFPLRSPCPSFRPLPRQGIGYPVSGWRGLKDAKNIVVIRAPPSRTKEWTRRGNPHWTL